MRAFYRRLAIWIFVLSVAVDSGSADQPGHVPDRPDHHVWLVSDRWHTSIVLAQRDIAATDLLPEASDLQDARFLAFGWGDRAFYMADDPGLWVMLRAAAVKTPAVLHVEGLRSVPTARPKALRVMRRTLGPEALRSLIRALSGSFDRAGNARATTLSRGLSRHSYFYPAKGRFHLFNTCNTWAARMLEAAGLDVSPDGVVRPGDLLSQL